MRFKFLIYNFILSFIDNPEDNRENQKCSAITILFSKKSKNYLLKTTVKRFSLSEREE